MELSYISGKRNLKDFLYLRKQKTPKFFYIFLKESCSYISGNRNLEKIPYVSGDQNFLCPRKFFIFQEVTFEDQKSLKLFLIKKQKFLNENTLL